jgi:hypothetical protein
VRFERQGGLFVPSTFNINHQHTRVRTSTVRGRGRVKITTVGLPHESTTTQIESDERLDAIVRPRAVALALRRVG